MFNVHEEHGVQRVIREGDEREFLARLDRNVAAEGKKAKRPAEENPQVGEPLHLYNIAVDAESGMADEIMEALEAIGCSSINVTDEGPSEIPGPGRG